MLSRDEMIRYSRHLILPEVGAEGQHKLKRAAVLVVGAGGLGAPAALYLAAAGVGRLGLVDFDVVDVSNLQRQVIFGTRDAGLAKSAAACQRLHDLNPEIELTAHDTKLTSENAIEILGAYDVVVDGSDNFAAKYLVNDACVLLKKPDVYGSVLRFEGQASVFGADGGPCYRCLFPDPPPPGSVPDCADAGVLGVLPGIVGSIQAAETLKLILGTGDSLAGRLLLFDALAMRMREVKIPRNPDCPVCGDNPTIEKLIDYDEFCGAVASPETASEIPEITPKDLKAKMEADTELVLVDIREPYEHEICDIGGRLIPMRGIGSRLGDLDRNAATVVYCRIGVRSAEVVRLMLDAGFTQVWNLRGGLHAWATEVDPSLPIY
ncbi:MAG: molybdopterin-synthase adenylyltransferase MoeB [Candidatus Krumholzibacteria bacterium]|nr:molybdopterin-synthase adenylyltransferase MoeB [Candidatus Krumholzibacteria bacterium]